jgi:hypothetical protein
MNAVVSVPLVQNIRPVTSRLQQEPSEICLSDFAYRLACKNSNLVIIKIVARSNLSGQLQESFAGHG